jgi:hypothetical protein
VVEQIFLGLADARQAPPDSRRVAPVINVRDLHDGQVPPIASLAKRALTAGVDVARYTVRADDVVITCRGTQLKIANITPESAGAVISSNLIAIRAGQDLLPAVLLAFLRSPATQQSLLRRAQSSTSSISLTSRSLGELMIPVPPLTIQTQIADLVIAAEDNFVAATRAAEQRRAVAHRIAFDVLRGNPGTAREQR